MISFDGLAGIFAVVTSAVAVGGALAPLLRTTLEKALGFQFDKRLEEFRYGVRVREQAARIAEYLALHMLIEETDSKEDYARINKLGWELALYLPSEIYKHLRDAAINRTPDRNSLTALVAVREYLLRGEGGELTPDDISFHYPGIRKIIKAKGMTTFPDGTPI